MVHKKPTPASLLTFKQKALAPVVAAPGSPRKMSAAKAKAIASLANIAVDAVKHMSDQTHAGKAVAPIDVDVVANINSKNAPSPTHVPAPTTPNRRRANGAKRAIGPEFRGAAVHTITA